MKFLRALEPLRTSLEWNVSDNGMEYMNKPDVLVAARYFRPPYGTIGARTRQRLAHLLDDPYIVNWSVDIEDWLYADSDTPEKQLEAFQRDVDRGGDIVVMHYLSRSTVQYFREVIRIARETGKRIMRVDQCMLDPEAPPLEDKSWD